MNKCFLQGHGCCGGKITGEHYISKTVLEALGHNGCVEIGGLPWLPDQTIKKIGIGSLVSNMLCDVHNSALSYLDSEAGKFFRVLIAADKQPAILPPLTEVSGMFIERWLIKVLCGLASSAGFNNATIPDTWKRLLVGDSWPSNWGLYVPSPSGHITLANEFYLETLVNSETREVKAAMFRLAGVHFTMLLGQPGNPLAWGKYHPRGLIFNYPDNNEKKLEFKWPEISDDAIIYTKFGSCNTKAPQWKGWRT